VSLSECKDFPLWRWAANKVFSVKSVYNHLTKNEVGVDYRRVWKAKLPEKIKIFMWFLEQKVVLTKDNTIRRKWQLIRLGESGRIVPLAISVGKQKLMITYFSDAPLPK
jgi:hypothetical protein